MNYKHILGVATLAAASAMAQTNVTWVASFGSDLNTCSRTAPCRTFATAQANTLASGVIKAIDAAEYGMITVTKALTIDGNGVGAMVEETVAGGAGIYVAAGPVTIKDLTIHVGSGVLQGYGISVAADTHVENVLITGSPYVGIEVGSSVSKITSFSAKNVTVTSATQIGLEILQSQASVRDSVFRAPGGYAVHVGSNTTFPTIAMFERTEMSYSFLGLWSDDQFGGTSAIVRISDCVITGNTTGIYSSSGGQIITFRTNMIAGNTTDGTTPLSTSLK